MIVEPSTRAASGPSPRAVALMTVAFWGGFLALYTLRGAVVGMSDPAGAFARRLAVVMIAAGAALLMRAAVGRLGRGRMARTLGWTVLLAAPAAAVFALANVLAFDVLAPLDAGACGARGDCSAAGLAPAVADLALNRWFVFIAWGVLDLLVRLWARPAEAVSREESQDPDALWAPTRGGLARIPLAEIRRVEAERDYVRIVAEQGSYLLRAPLATMQARLDPDRFVRVHRSTLLRADDIVGLRRANGAWVALDHAGQATRVGRRYLDAVRRRLGVAE